MIWQLINKKFKSECVKPTLKHGCGSVMVWGYFSSNGVGKFVFIDGIMRKEEYLKILEDNLYHWRSMVNSEKDFIFQQDNDPKHTVKILSQFLAENNINALDWVV